MKVIKILLVLAILFISISAVSAEGNFTALQEEIDSSTDSIEITQDYVYDNSTDYELDSGILINKSDFTINGNGNTIDGSNQARIFNITGTNITISNLIFINGFNSKMGGAIFAYENVNIIDCVFENNTAINGGAICLYMEGIILNCDFIKNIANTGAAIYFNKNGQVINSTFTSNIGSSAGAIYAKELNCENSDFENNTALNGAAVYTTGPFTLKTGKFINNKARNNGAIYCNNATEITDSTFYGNEAKWGGSIYSTLKAEIENSVFSNAKASYGAAIFGNHNLTVINSTFENLHANETAGAIGFKELNYFDIQNSTFINISSRKNGGAIYIDMGDEENGTSHITNTAFYDSSSDFGGALVQLSGEILIEDCKFENNTATYDGGAVYISDVTANIINTTFKENKLVYENFSCGGGFYSDNSETEVEDCEFIGNSFNGIYAYDSILTVNNTSFSDNTEAIHGVFIDYEIENVDLDNDTLFLNDTNYASNVYEIGKTIILINNTIDVENLPSRYDSRDWGWVSSVKDQGDLGSCWTFGNCGALESALLKATGIEYDFSESNMQNSMLQYSKYGFLNQHEGGLREEGLEYAISWFGMLPAEYDAYDELGKLSPLITSDKMIHIFDATFAGIRKNSTDNAAIKELILMCGSVTTGYYHNNNAYNAQTFSYYQNTKNNTNHAISLVGWDDNYPASNFLITPPGDGAFILKNSWGTGFGDKGYMYISYYDTSILNTTFAVGYNIENTENYTRNYQTDLGGGLEYRNNDGKIISYTNTYEAFTQELISAVGTYFDPNEDYKIEIYVNDELVHTENGTNDLAGYHTIKLSNEIPITGGDNFTVVMKKYSAYLLTGSRQHYLENVSFIDTGEGWEDIALSNKTFSLKVYTKDLPIYTEDLVKIYKNDSKFEAEIGAANETVTFEINGGSYNRISDENGTARMAINLGPGNYTIKTTYNNITVENTITVLPTLIADNLVKYFKNASQFYVSLIDGEGNPVAGVNITMNINGVFYNRTTNENGTAKLNINLAPGEYILTAIDPLTGLMMSYNITVLATLNATDLEMKYKDGSTFNVTVLDGQGKPLANAKVTFNINGVLYNRYSDSNGIAKLNINLMAGKYIITSDYDGMRIANTITIKD